MLTDGGDHMVELIVGGHPELDPAGAAPDVPGQSIGGRGEVDDDTGFVTGHPGVVAGGDDMGVARSEVSFAPVVHTDVEASRDDVARVGHLAGAGTDQRSNIARPSPS